MLANPHTFLKTLDCNFESFFYQRPYSLGNFNFYIKLLGEQRRLDLLPGTLEKMKASLPAVMLRFWE